VSSSFFIGTFIPNDSLSFSLRDEGGFSRIRTRKREPTAKASDGEKGGKKQEREVE